jgi:hypothetical protein
MNMSLLLLEFACGALLCSLLLIPGLVARFSRSAGYEAGTISAATEPGNNQPGGGR